MRVLALGLLSAVVVAACGGGVAGSYLYQGEGRLVFLTMAGEGQSLTGSLTVFTANSFMADGGEATTVDFTGSSSGSTVALIFPSSSDYTGLSATLQGDGLHLSFPGGGGTFQEILLKRSSQADYNSAVAGFATAAQQAIASAEAQAVIDKPVVDASASLQSAINDLGDVRPLDPPSSIATDDLRSQLSELKDGAAGLESSLADCHADPYFGCSESDFSLPIGIGYEVYFCKSFRYDAGGDERFVKEFTAPYFSSAARVNTAADRLDQVVAANPSAAKPTISTSAARAAAAAARSKASNYIAAWNSELTTAQGLRDQAMALYVDAIKIAKKYGLTIEACKPTTWAQPLPVPTS